MHEDARRKSTGRQVWLVQPLGAMPLGTSPGKPHENGYFSYWLASPGGAMGAHENLFFLAKTVIFLIGRPALWVHENLIFPNENCYFSYWLASPGGPMGAHESLIFLNENCYFSYWLASPGGPMGAHESLIFLSENCYFSYWLASPRGPWGPTKT